MGSEDSPMVKEQSMIEKINNMNEDQQLKLKYDYIVNMPILMRVAFANAKNPELNLSKEQIDAIKKHKFEVMDSIDSVMVESHKLSKELRDGLLYGNISEQKAFELAKEITRLKEQTLNMKIVCINFMKKELTKEQFTKLLEFDKKMPYLNSPYNY
jgi:hypothetical protein